MNVHLRVTSVLPKLDVPSCTLVRNPTSLDCSLQHIGPFLRGGFDVECMRAVETEIQRTTPLEVEC
jgi:hypothetical protein